MSKVFFVTGTSRGLGRRIVEAALADGHRVAATARDPRTLDDLVARYGGRVRAVALDVTDPVAARAAVRAAADAFGRIDVVVNNAGQADRVALEDTTLEGFRRQVETNFMGVVYVTKAALPLLREQGGGHLIQVSSLGGRIGSPGMTPISRRNGPSGDSARPSRRRSRRSASWSRCWSPAGCEPTGRDRR